jgi:hypothetical protein
VSLNRQLAIFSADSSRPSVNDLAGLLIGPGQVVRMGGTARVSVVVDAPWRVHALAAEFAVRGLDTSWVPTVEEHFGVRTAYTGVLAPLASVWLPAAVKQPPANFFLDGVRLRLWFAAAGALTDGAVLLRLGAHDLNCAVPALRALLTLAVPAELLRGPVLRITGRRRLARVAELVGDRPAMAPPDAWPS